MHIKGPFNIQYLLKGDDLYVIECNLRASRSIPFVSKTGNINLIELATEVMLGKTLENAEIPSISHFGVKVPQFPFVKLEGADPILGVEMVSTGEVACLGDSFSDALLKSLIASQLKIPSESSSVLISVSDKFRPRILEIARRLRQMGFRIYATPRTSAFLLENGIVARALNYEDKGLNISDYLVNRKIDLVITTPIEDDYTESECNYWITRKAIDFNIPTILNMELAEALTEAIEQRRKVPFQMKSWNEYFA